MKKQIAIALTTALLAFPITPSLVLADTSPTGTTAVTSTPSTTTTTSGIGVVQDQNGITVAPGILPGSPFYWFKTLIEKVQLALTFDSAKKAEVVEQQALENLAEAQALAAKGDTTDAEKALTEYSAKIEQAQAFLDQLKDPNSETAQKVQLALTKVNTNSMVVLGGLLEKLPPQAAQKLALNIVRSLEKAVARVDKMSKTQDPTTTTRASAITMGTSNSTETDQLNDQAKQALEKFQVGLGLKKANHTPNGNAYGYYKNKQGNKEDQNADQEDSATTTQQQTQQGTQQQYQASQPQATLAPASKKQEDQNKGEKGEKEKVEKGHRD